MPSICVQILMGGRVQAYILFPLILLFWSAEIFIAAFCAHMNTEMLNGDQTYMQHYCTWRRGIGKGTLSTNRHNTNTHTHLLPYKLVQQVMVTKWIICICVVLEKKII